MGDINDDRQEYIPANRSGRPLQRPLSAHVSNRPTPPAAPFQKQQAAGNGISSPYRRIHSAAPYRPTRPLSASIQPSPVPAWGDGPGAQNQSYSNGFGATAPTTGLFAGMEQPPSFSRQDHGRVVSSKEPESMEDELRKMRQALSSYKEQNRLLSTERKRLEEQLGKARTNLVKAEELLNAREKALSPTIGLSQMYRTPETTALVTRLKEQVKQLREEKERFKGDLEELLRSTKATRVAELQSEAHALSQELSRQVEMTAIMRWRMEKAEELAAEAQQKAEAAEAKARQYTEAGSVLPPGPVRLAPGNTISSGRVRKTMAAMQQSHRVLLSQAALLRAVFPPGLSMDALSAKAELKASTAGAVEVVRYIRYHLNKLHSEMGGLPGARPDENAALEPASPPQAPKPPRPRSARPQSAGPASPIPVEVPKPPEPSSDPRLLLQGIADLVRELRSMDMDSFMARPDLEADVEQLADVAGLLMAEHKRLTGSSSASVFNDDNAQENPLYTPVPKSDLVEPEYENKDEPVEEEAEPELVEYAEEPAAEEEEQQEEAIDKEEEQNEDNGDGEEYPDDFLEQDEPVKAEGEAPVEEKSSKEPAEETDEDKAKAAVAKVMAAAEKAEAVVAKLEAIAARLAPELSTAAAPEPEPSDTRSHAEEVVDPEPEPASPKSASEPEPEPEPEVAAEEPPVAVLSLPLAKEHSSQSTRSVASSHSPDTPKRIEGPASSVGDPMEYGTRRSSITGSVYSARGWQPADDVLREEDDEAGLIGVAVAAAAAIMFADDEQAEEAVNKEPEAESVSVVSTAKEPEPEVEEPGKDEDAPPQEPTDSFGALIASALAEVDSGAKEPEKEASRRETQTDAPSVERQPRSTIGGEPSIEETPWWNLGGQAGEGSDEQSETIPASEPAASQKEVEDPGYESPRGEVTLQDIAAVEPKELPAGDALAESVSAEGERPASVGWPTPAKSVDDFYENLNSADDDGKLFVDDDEPAPRQSVYEEQAAEAQEPTEEDMAAPSDPDVEQPQSPSDWQEPAVAEDEVAGAALGTMAGEPQDAEEGIPPADDCEDPLPLGGAWEAPAYVAQKLGASSSEGQPPADEGEGPAAAADDDGVSPALDDEAEEPAAQGGDAEDVPADEVEGLSAYLAEQSTAGDAEVPPAQAAHHDEAPASAGDAEELPVDFADEPSAPADDADEPPAPVDFTDEPPAPVDFADEPPASADDADEPPVDFADDADEPPVDFADDADEPPVDFADDADELPVPVDFTDEPPAPADDADEPPAPTDFTDEPPAPVDDADEPPAPADEPPAPVDGADEPPAPADEADESPTPAHDADEPPAPADFADEPPAPANEADEPPASADDADEPPAPADDVTPAAVDYGAEPDPPGEEPDPAPVDDGLPTPIGNADWYDDGEAALPGDDEPQMDDQGAPSAGEEAAEDKELEPADAEAIDRAKAGDEEAGAAADAHAQDISGQPEDGGKPLERQVAETAQPGDDKPETDAYNDDTAATVNSGAKDEDVIPPSPAAGPPTAPPSRPAALDDDF